ncbi:DUF4446 family protein [Thermincola potens]|uniref:DUF4446 domain-containing protein n=1 Tax=Thermincola potens (strain JR) TaxID=635013 RepID=D5XDT1_THEPJ|nr:DUF4446 family protein [Thermincola potens]ADG83827.1 conserved hypothetical protein [Thermincola potens JR]
METLIQVVEMNGPFLLIFSIVLGTLNLVLFFILLGRYINLNKRYKKLVRGMDNRNLEDILHAHMERVAEVVREMNGIAATCRELKSITEKSIQKVGVVRFNAFADTGSDLSFAVALLDKFGDGVVLSSIFGRDDQRTYAKPVKNGDSTYQLSDEELEAIRIALQRK